MWEEVGQSRRLCWLNLRPPTQARFPDADKMREAASSSSRDLPVFSFANALAKTRRRAPIMLRVDSGR